MCLSSRKGVSSGAGGSSRVAQCAQARAVPSVLIGSRKSGGQAASPTETWPPGATQGTLAVAAARKRSLAAELSE